MSTPWPAEDRVRDIQGAVSRLNLCPKPPHLNLYDIVEIVNHEKQVRVVPLEGKRGILLAWHFDMCMWTVRLLEAADTRDSAIEREKNQASTADGTYYTLPTCHLKLLSTEQGSGKGRQKRVSAKYNQKRAPSVTRQPPSVRSDNETRIIPFTASGRLWQVEYPDDKVAFPAITLRATESDSLHIWRRGPLQIEERVTDELDVRDDDSELGVDYLIRRPHLGYHTPSGKQLAKRAKRSESVPGEIAAYTTAVPGEKGTYTISAGQFEDAVQNGAGMFQQISLRDMDLIIRDGMFTRKSAGESIALLVSNAKKYEQAGNLHLATQQISLAIRAYGNVDDVSPNLYATRSRYWQELSSNEHNRETRERYKTYAIQDAQRMRAQRDAEIVQFSSGA